MTTLTHPFAALRKNIRQSGKQYRHNADNSPSLFHPEEGFTYAYDVHLVEEALDAFEKAIASSYLDENGQTLTVEQKLVREAQEIVCSHDDMAVRDFARSVAAYLIINAPERPGRDPAKVLQLVPRSDIPVADLP